MQTNKRKVWKARQYHILREPRAGGGHYPIIVHCELGVFAPASIFINEISKWRQEKLGSVLDIAYIICSWCNYLQDRNCEWNCASDEYFHSWLTSGREIQGLSNARIARRASVIFRWSNFLLNRGVGGSPLREFASSISAEPESFLRGTARPRFKAMRGPKLKRGKKRIPSPEEAARVVDCLGAHPNPFIAERDWLIGQVALETGLRAMGLAKLCTYRLEKALREENILVGSSRLVEMTDNSEDKASLRRTLIDLQDRGRLNVFLEITEKGGKHRIVAFSIDLVLAVLEHIWGERAQLLRRQNWEPFDGRLWLSERFRRPLAVGSIKDLIRKRGYKSANVPGSAHSFRATFLTGKAAELLLEEKELWGDQADPQGVLLKLAEIAGHEDTSTLKPYLDEAQIRWKLWAAKRR